jgi:hypothetical protein
VNLTSISRVWGEGSYLPCAPAAGEGAVEPFSATLVPHLLLPQGYVGAVIANIGVEGWQGSSENDVRGLLSSEIGFVGGARPLV